MRPPSALYQNQRKIQQKKRKKLQASITDEHRQQKSSKKTLAVQIQQYFERIIHHDQVGLTSEIQEFFNIHKSISVIHTDQHIEE